MRGLFSLSDKGMLLQSSISLLTSTPLKGIEILQPVVSSPPLQKGMNVTVKLATCESDPGEFTKQYYIAVGGSSIALSGTQVCRITTDVDLTLKLIVTRVKHRLNLSISQMIGP